MSIAGVAPLLSFGVRATCRDPYLFMDEHSLLYISGGNLVVYSPQPSRSQKFIPGSTRDAVITAISLTRERHYLAVAENLPVRSRAAAPTAANPTVSGSGGTVGSVLGSMSFPGKSGHHGREAPTVSNVVPGRPVIHLFGLPTLRKRKTLSLEEVYPIPDRRPKEVVALSFSSDSKNLAAVTADLFVSYWSWEKARSLGVAIIPPPPHLAVSSTTSVTATAGTADGDRQRRPGTTAAPTANPAESTSHALQSWVSNLSIAVNPSDEEQIAVHSHGLLRIFRASDGALKPVPLKLPVAESEITCFGWVSAARYVVGARGCLIMMENGVFKAFYALDPALISLSNLSPIQSPPIGTGDSTLTTFKPLPRAGAIPTIGITSAGPDPTNTTTARDGSTPLFSNSSAVTNTSTFPPAPGSYSGTYAPVDALTMSPRLLIVSCRGTVVVYERNSRDASDLFKFVCRSPIAAQPGTVVANVTAAGPNGGSASTGGSLSTTTAPGPEQAAGPGIQRYRSMLISASEELLLVVAEEGSCQMLNISMIDLAKGDTLQSVPVLPAFHSGPVTSMDVCVRKPLAVTCSADKSVRIWNFVNFTCELCKYFPEEPLSISMHPSGYYLLVGFADKLRLYTIIPDDLRTLHEFPIRGCRECAFARGGHQFAAVQGPLILIFNAWTFEQVATLKAHNGRVRSLYWTRGTHGLSAAPTPTTGTAGGGNAVTNAAAGNGASSTTAGTMAAGLQVSRHKVGADLDDARLVSCGADGAVYTWELLSGVLRGPAISGSTTASSLSAGGTHGTMRPESLSSSTSAVSAAAAAASAEAAAAAAQHVAAGAKRVNEYIHKGVTFTSAIDIAGNTFAVGSDRVLRSITDSLLVREVKCPGADLTQIAVSQSGRMMFVATALGSIKAVRSPLPTAAVLAAAATSSGTGSGGTTDGAGGGVDLDSEDLAQEHAAHSAPVVKMRVTADDKFLVSAGEDGCLMVCRISDRDSAAKAQQAAAAAAAAATASATTAAAAASPTLTVAAGDAEDTKGTHQTASRATSPTPTTTTTTHTGGTPHLALTAAGTLPNGVESAYAEEVIVTKTDLEERAAIIAEMRTRLEELKMEQDYQLRLKDMNLTERLKELTVELSKQIESLKSSAAVLRSEKDRDEAKHKDDFSLLCVRNSRGTRDLENKNNQQLMVEYERFQALQDEMRTKQRRWETRLADFETERAGELATMTDHFDDLLHAKADEVVKLQEAMAGQLREFTEHQRQQAEDIESEVAIHEDRYEQALRAERDVSMRLKGENGIYKKKFLTLNKEIDDNKLEMAKLRETEARLRKVMAAFEREVDGLKAEMIERDKMIQDQERRVYELKKSNQELEKFKFVLDHKIKDLKKQIEPREQSIADMRLTILATNEALTAQRKHEHAVHAAENELRTRLTAANEEAALAHRRAQALLHMLKQCQTDVTLAIQHIQDPSMLGRALKNAHAKHCKGMSPSATKVVTPSDVEVGRQEVALKSTIKQLKRVLDSQASEFRIEHFAHVQENKALIGEIRRLRGERESLPTLKFKNGQMVAASSTLSLDFGS